MTPSKSLTLFPHFPPKADTSQTSDKQLALLWLIAPRGLGRLFLNMSSTLHIPCLLPFSALFSLGSIAAGCEWWGGEGQGWVIGPWVVQGQDWSDHTQRHRKNQKH